VDTLNNLIKTAEEKYSFVFVTSDALDSQTPTPNKIVPPLNFLEPTEDNTSYEVFDFTDDLLSEEDNETTDENSFKRANNTPSSDTEMTTTYVAGDGDGIWFSELG